MDRPIAHLDVFLDSLNVGCTEGGFSFAIAVPTGRWPVFAQHVHGVVGRLTILLDPVHAPESFAEELFEPLEELAIDGHLMIGGEVARQGVQGRTLDIGLHEVDDSGANVLVVPVPEGATVEVAWWYGGDDEADHEGITALDLLWDRRLDPMDADSPVRNMSAVIRQFFRQHGAPSLQPDDGDDP